MSRLPWHERVCPWRNGLSKIKEPAKPATLRFRSVTGPPVRATSSVMDVCNYFAETQVIENTLFGRNFHQDYTTYPAKCTQRDHLETCL
jgi:hypothetical protein